MIVTLDGKEIQIRPVDRLNFQWMLERLIDDRPGFAFFKCQLEGELVYVFSRHQHYLGKRWPCLFIMGKGWKRPIVLNNKEDWLECYQHLLILDRELSRQAPQQPIIR